MKSINFFALFEKQGLGKVAFASILAFASSASYSATSSTSTTFEYDSKTGLVAAQVVNPDKPQYNIRTEFTYDSFGNRLTTKVSSAATGLSAIAPRTSNTVTYDPYGLAPTKFTNAIGQSAKTQFDPASMPTWLQSLNGIESTWEYDSLGRKIRERRPDGTETRWQYSLCSSVPCSLSTSIYSIRETSYARDLSTQNAPWTYTYFDSLDRIVRVETQGFDGTSVIRVDTEYDALGRVSRKSRPYYAGQAIQWTRYAYDALSRSSDVTNADGSVVHTDYAGLSVTVTNPLGHKQTTTSDGQGRVVKVIDAQGNQAAYEYDVNGNLTKTIDPKGNVLTMAYDVLNRKTSMVDPNMGIWTYAYDVLGQLRQQTNSRGQVTTLTYDTLGRLTNRTEPDLKSDWTYDSCTMGLGKLCKVASDNGYASTSAYDSLSRPAGTVTTIDASYNSSVTYDANGRLATQTYPNGLTVKYSYTGLGYFKEIRNAATNSLYWQADALDAEGHLTQQTYGNGVVTRQSFDPQFGRLASISAGVSNSVQNLTFAYDAVGNMQSRTDGNQQLFETFLFDALNRLTNNTVHSSAAGLKLQTYEYDVTGNITSRSDLGTYSYGANAGPNAVTQIALASGGKRNFAYDGTGNLISDQTVDSNGLAIPGKARAYSYTSFNMPNTMTGGQGTLKFLYGPDHQRIKQIAPSGTTIYLHPDNSGGLAYEKETKADGTVEHRNFIAAAGSVVAVVKQIGSSPSRVLYMHRDNLGSTTAVTDGAGSVIERMAYEPFGKRRVPTGQLDEANSLVGIGTNRGFTNHEHLEELGLIHMNGRVYDPTTGRFISPDPGIPVPLDLQSFNRYSYTRNNPLRYVDMNGYEETEGKVSYVEPVGAGLSIAEALGADYLAEFGGELIPAVVVPRPSTFVVEVVREVPVESAIINGAGGMTPGQRNFLENTVAGLGAGLDRKTTEGPPSRHEAFRKAKQDAGVTNRDIPRIEYEDLYDKDSKGNKIFVRDEKGKVVQSRVYVYELPNGQVRIQEHSVGHIMDRRLQETGHYNVRDAQGNTLKGAKEHYYFKGRLDPFRYFWRNGGGMVPRGEE